MNKAAIVGFLAVLSGLAYAQDDARWQTTCEKHPEYCSEKIVAMTDEEKASIALTDQAEKDTYAAWLDAIQKASDARDAVVKAHHMQNYPAARATSSGIIGGTCMGEITFVDGYIHYKPADDIRMCGDYVKKASKKEDK